MNKMSAKSLSNKQLLGPYVAPYCAYVLLASIPANILSQEGNYLLRIIITSGLLLWGWKYYAPIRGPLSPLISIVSGAAVGLAGTALWVLLLLPFVQGAGGAAWNDTAFWLRFLAAGFVTPVFEELLMRGYAFSFALQWDQERKSDPKSPLENTLEHRSIHDVPAGSWSFVAVTASTIVFTLGHSTQEWIAAVAYGLLMSALLIFRKDLLSCIIAHGVTNIALALYIKTAGAWGLW
jgi:membrane protease YdiL (CAAX protease family)